MTKSSNKYIYILIILSAALLFIRLGSISLYQVAEARNAECAREMLVNDDWVVPIYNNHLRTDKPALEYFAMIASYVVGGVGEGSARFFSAVCGLLLIVFTFFFTSSYLGKKVGWWASLTLLASIHCMVQFRLATPDPYLILTNTIALYCFLKGWSSEKWKWWALMYIFLGLAVFAKGPIGVLLPGLIILLFLVIKRSLHWKTIGKLKPWWGLLLLLLFSAPWYILVHLRTDGAWTEGFFITHNVDRFSDTMGGHGGPFILTFLFVILGMLPFSLFIIQSIGHTWKRMFQKDILLLSFLAFACIVGFYAVSRTKLINYTVPAYPFIAIMLGYYLNNLCKKVVKGKGLIISYILLLIICIGLPIAYYFWSKSLPELQSLSWMTIFFILFPVGGIFAFYYFRKKRFAKSFYFITGTFILSALVIFVYPYPQLDAQTPVRQAQHLLYKDRPIAFWKKFNDDFVFYAKHPIPFLEDSSALDAFLQNHQNALIISISKDQAPLKSRKDLQLIQKRHEIFNSHISYIYQQTAPLQEE